MFVIIVDFLIKENEVENFKPLMLENARASLMDESGCRQSVSYTHLTLPTSR